MPSARTKQSSRRSSAATAISNDPSPSDRTPTNIEISLKYFYGFCRPGVPCGCDPKNGVYTTHCRLGKCKFDGPDARSLTRHFEKKHSREFPVIRNGKIAYRCPIPECNRHKVPTAPRNIVGHLNQVYTRNLVSKCKYCSAQFTDATYLSRHTSDDCPRAPKYDQRYKSPGNATRAAKKRKSCTSEIVMQHEGEQVEDAPVAGPSSTISPAAISHTLSFSRASDLAPAATSVDSLYLGYAVYPHQFPQNQSYHHPPPATSLNQATSSSHPSPSFSAPYAPIDTSFSYLMHPHGIPLDPALAAYDASPTPSLGSSSSSFPPSAYGVSPFAAYSTALSESQSVLLPDTMGYGDIPSDHDHSDYIYWSSSL